jgi:gamma-glutamyltranspeptidase/glutathione hydrolase
VSAPFTTRPELLGDHHLVASTHYLATAAGVSMLERGGTAADAAVATGFVLQVVEPHLCGPGGEVPIIVRTPEGTVEVICGQGVAPASATAEHFRSLGLDQVPGAGLLAATVPGQWGAWLLLLQRHGRLSLREVLEPALALAEEGFPLSAGAAQAVGVMSGLFRRHWPSCAEVWLDQGSAPTAGQRWRWPALARTWRRLLAEAEAATERDEQLERARAAWYSGFVAEEIDLFCARDDIPDAEGRAVRGLLSFADLSAWRAEVEQSASVGYAGWQVHKTQTWGQGPVMLLWLSLLAGLDLPTEPTDPDGDVGADFVHLVTETGKLAMADREAWFGDPLVAPVPLAQLLEPAYASARLRRVGEQASYELRPGSPAGQAPLVPAHPVLTDAAAGPGAHLGGHVSEPTRGLADELTNGLTDETVGRGDTCHLDAADRSGLVISATPSGGWLQSSPVIPALGFPLGSRLQMAWVHDTHPARLVPGHRPRTTLTPSLAVHEDGRVLAWGTPGGDQQDQWSTLMFLRHVHHGRGLQAAIDAPAFHSEHAPSSFWPRQSRPGRLVLEASFTPAVQRELTRRGHDVQVLDAWSQGRLSAVQWEPGGWLRAAANPRGMLGYAAGR